VEARPGTVEARPGTVKAHLTREPRRLTLEPHLGAVEDHPGAMEDHPGVLHAHPEALHAMFQIRITSMRIWILTRKKPDTDPHKSKRSDPDPQHWLKILLVGNLPHIKRVGRVQIPNSSSWGYLIRLFLQVLKQRAS
jgi:hypothetical protein